MLKMRADVIALIGLLGRERSRHSLIRPTLSAPDPVLSEVNADENAQVPAPADGASHVRATHSARTVFLLTSTPSENCKVRHMREF